MHNFEAWAPDAEALAVEVDGKRYPMQKGPHGVWSGRVGDAKPGSEYGFVLGDSNKAIPDPRSPWQPNGVNGLSKLIDHTSFQWSDDVFQASPLAGAIIYELHIGTFTEEGTLDAAIRKLDYLRDLGVTHVELLPIAAFSGEHGWGYDGVALYAPHAPYGGPEAVKRFVNAAHCRSLAVLIDVVYNHFGPSGNYTGNYGPYLNENHKTPWGGAVNLEAEGADQVRKFFIENALMWLRDYHFDGLRLDAVHAFVDRSAVNFLEQINDEVNALSAQTGRHLMVIAESDSNDPRVVRAKEAGGFGLDAQWSDDFHHALWAVLTGDKTGYYQDFGSMQQLATALQEVFVYQGQYAPHRKRNHGRPVRYLSGHRFLGYIQNHDQVGNRANGERLSHVVSPGKVKIAAALVLCAATVPMLFQGEEFAASTPFRYFTDHEDAELGKAVSEGRKKEFASFGWEPESVPDPQSPETYQISKLKWNEIGEEFHASILQWYKDLIALRKSSRSLTDGDLSLITVRFNQEDQWLVMKRGRLQVVCNFRDQAANLPVMNSGTIVLTSDTNAHMEDNRVQLGPESVVILKS